MAKKSAKPTLNEKAELANLPDRYELEKVLIIEQIDNLAAQSELLRAQVAYNNALAADTLARTSRENKQYS